MGKFPMVFSIGLFTLSNVLYETLKKHDFTKMAVSRLIMVRFSKFEIWHTLHFDPDLLDVSDITRDVRRAR